MNSPLQPRIIVSLLVATLAGCSSFEKIKDLERTVAVNTALADQERARLVDQVKNQGSIRQQRQEVGRPYVVGKPIPLSRDATLPVALQRGVTTEIIFENNRQLDLTEAASRITLATGIPVRVKPDALLPLSSFMPRSVGSAAGERKDGPARGLATAGLTVDLSMKAVPLANLLDSVATQLGIYWRYVDGTIEFYRVDTRVFRLATLAQQSSSSSSQGRAAASGTGFVNQSEVRLDTKAQDPIEGIRKAVEGMMTRAGGMTVSPESGAITVTDTQETLDRIERFMEQENRLLTKRIKLIFEVIELTLKDSQAQGINWALIGEKLGNPPFSFSNQNAPSLTNKGANRLTAGITFANGVNVEAVIEALSEVGKVTAHTSLPLSALNRRPVSNAVRQTFNYVDSVKETTAVINGQAQAPSKEIVQKEETVGTIVTIVPDAQDDGKILMSVSFDTSDLVSLMPFGDQGQTVQQKQINGSGTVQQVVVRSGQTVILSGFERNRSQYGTRRVDEHASMLLGGSNKTETQRSTTVLLLTAIAEEGV